MNDRKPITADPFDRPDDADTVTTSTSVFVAQPGSDASGTPVILYRENQYPIL